MAVKISLTYPDRYVSLGIIFFFSCAEPPRREWNRNIQPISGFLSSFLLEVASVNAYPMEDTSQGCLELVIFLIWYASICGNIHRFICEAHRYHLGGQN